MMMFRSGQMFQQIALRLHPAGVLYLTLRFTSLKEAYNRYSSSSPSSRWTIPLKKNGLQKLSTSCQDFFNTTRSTNTMAPLGQLFGVSLETVLENEASGFLVPLLVKLCIQVLILVMMMITGNACDPGDWEKGVGHNRALPSVWIRDKEENAPRGVWDESWGSWLELRECARHQCHNKWDQCGHDPLITNISQAPTSSFQFWVG